MIRPLLTCCLFFFFSFQGSGQQWASYFDTAYSYQGKDNLKAIEYYLLAKNNLPADSATSLTHLGCVNQIAVLYAGMKMYREAEPFFVELRTGLKTMMGPGKIYRDFCLNFASMYSEMGENAKATEIYQEVKSITGKIAGNSSLEYAQTTALLGWNYNSLNDYAKAEASFSEAESILSERFPNDLTYAQVCLGLGTLYDLTGKYTAGEKLLITAATIFEKTNGKKDPLYLQSRSNLAFLYYHRGWFDRSESINLEVKDARAKTLGRRHPDYSLSCNNLALVYADLGFYDKSEMLYQEALSITREVYGTAHQEYATCISNLGLLYKAKGQLENAERYFLEAKKITEKLEGKNSLNYALRCNLLATLYVTMGQYDKAEPLFLESKEIRFKLTGNQNMEYATACSNLGTLYLQMGYFKKAEKYLLEALPVIERSVGKNHPSWAGICANLAALYRNNSQPEKAGPLYIQYREAIGETLGKEHAQYADACHSLGIFYNDIEQYDKAAELFLEAEQVMDKALGPGHIRSAEIIKSRAANYWMTGKFSEADKLFRKAFDVKYQYGLAFLQFTSEKEKTNYFKNAYGDNTLFNSFAYSQKNGDLAYTISFLSRNLILSSLQQLKKSVNTSKDPQLLSDYEKWIFEKKQLAAAYSNGNPESELKEREEITNLLEKKLAVASKDFQNDRQLLDWKQIRSALHKEEAAIEFIEFPYHNGKRSTDSVYYAALVLRKEATVPEFIPLFEKKQLDSVLAITGNTGSNSNVTSLYTLRGGELENNATGLQQSVYDLVWKPLERSMTGIKTIYFAPFGLLHRIAFAALPLNATEVLSDRYRLVQLNSTASVINRETFYVSVSDKISLFGGISYDADSTELKSMAVSGNTNTANVSLPPVTRGSTWTNLPGTKNEVEEIRLLAGKNNGRIVLLSGVNATEEAFKSLEGDSSPAVLHVATHGFFFPDPKEPAAGKVLNTNQNAVSFTQSDNPLLRSGLLFAGANYAWQGKALSGVQDGILTAYEVSNMYLPKTKLVVLSACETGLGTIRGSEGVYGLQRAFKMAGAENLIMSLWKVPDNETAEFMQALYKNLFDQKTIRDSFYQAQEAMKNKYRSDPYKWAAWILVQ